MGSDFDPRPYRIFCAAIPSHTLRQNSDPLSFVARGISVSIGNAVSSFIARFKAEFPLGRVSFDNFRKLFERGQPPRLLLVNDGSLLKIWDGQVPTLAEAQTFIE